MRIEAGDVWTGAPTYRNLKKFKFELFDVFFDKEITMFVLKKIRKN